MLRRCFSLISCLSLAVLFTSLVFERQQVDRHPARLKFHGYNLRIDSTAKKEGEFLPGISFCCGWPYSADYIGDYSWVPQGPGIVHVGMFDSYDPWHFGILVERHLGVSGDYTSTTEHESGTKWIGIHFPFRVVNITACFLPLLWIAARIFRRHHRKNRPSQQCASCGYDLRGTPDRCPECGTAVTAPK